MKELFAIKQNDFIFNHLVYDYQDDRIFAMHSHDLYELIYVRKGQVKYSIENQIFHAKQNDLIIIQPFSYHFFQIEGSCDYEKVGILFQSSTLPVALPFLQTATKLAISEEDIVNRIFNNLIFYYKTFSQEIFLDLLHSCAREIVYNLSLIKKGETTSSKLHPVLIQKALSFINDNLFTIQSVDEISEHLFVSKNYFSSLFTREMNISVMQYIREKRLLHARNMLLSGKKATKIFETVGYSSYTAFYRSYFSYFGSSPSDEKASKTNGGKKKKKMIDSKPID